MKIYFLASQPCALKIGGTFFGMVNDFERFAEFSLKDNLFVEFIPENALPICFFLNESIRFSPPANCDVYLLKDGIAIYARAFTPTDLTLRPIAQKRFDELLVTVFQQGYLQLSIQTPDHFFNATLPPSFSVCEIFLHGGFIFLKSPLQLAVFTKTGKQLFLERVLSWSADDKELRAVLPLSDARNRVADCTWELCETECKCTNFILRQSAENVAEPPPDLLAYAFFESLLIGADPTEFLSNELIPDADKISSFLGDFESVIPTDTLNVCGLIKRKSENLFEVVYYRTEMQNGKITDVKRI